MVYDEHGNPTDEELKFLRSRMNIYVVFGECWEFRLATLDLDKAKACKKATRIEVWVDDRYQNEWRCMRGSDEWILETDRPAWTQRECDVDKE